MKMFSNACKYALKAMLHISLNSSENEKIGIKEISEELNLPRPFLSKILQDLVRNKVLRSVKGVNGGFYLTKEEKSLPIIRVIEIIDGLDSFTRCGMGLSSCSQQKPCPIHLHFSPLRTKLKQVLEEQTIENLASLIESGQVFIKN